MEILRKLERVGKEQRLIREIVVPAFIQVKKASVDDVDALPASVAEFTDPAKSSALTQLSIYVGQIFIQGRQPDAEEQKALRLILSRLEYLRTDCQVRGLENFLDYLTNVISQLKKILGAADASRPETVKPDKPGGMVERLRGLFGKRIKK